MFSRYPAPACAADLLDSTAFAAGRFYGQLKVFGPSFMQHFYYRDGAVGVLSNWQA